MIYFELYSSFLVSALLISISLTSRMIQQANPKDQQ